VPAALDRYPPLAENSDNPDQDWQSGFARFTRSGFGLSGLLAIGHGHCVFLP
jgi:hypothetical protein